MTIKYDKIIVGIDTDSKGCISIIAPTKKIFEFYNMPLRECPATGKKMINPVELDNIISEIERKYSPDAYVIEKQNSRPGQSSVSMFTFAQNYGTIIAILSLHVNVERLIFVPASRWKVACGVTSNKAATKKRGNSLLVANGYAGKQVKISCAEAALMAFYGQARI